MKGSITIGIISAMALSSVTGVQGKVIRQELHEGWQFKSARETQLQPATVPGVVHTDLLAIGEIPDPFIGQNERAVQWVDKEDWIYETVFDAGSLFDEENIDLVFEGLDNYADVYLNDSLVLKANNMFREWQIPVKSLLKSTGNTLRVYFHSPIKTDIPKYDALPFQYYAGNDQSQTGGVFDKQVSVFARKAGYQYGWDWGPRLVTSGIWRPVYLEAWSGPRMIDAYITTNKIESGKATLTARLEISSQQYSPNLLVTVKDKSTGKVLAKENVNLEKGNNTFDIPFIVRNPKLWWTRDMGDPYLYDFSLELSAKGKVMDELAVTTGIRTVELVRDEDTDGRTFYFKLNGIPVYAKGANYIPSDNFLPRVTEEKYRKTLTDAADVNMNMIRVWGGGIYENDKFYELCDSLGLLVWQDFMFACSMYPANEEFLANVKEEAVDNVKRLRNHPSIALWCGNNEILEAWLHWGLRRYYNEKGVSDLVWQQYVDLFHELLPQVVEEYMPEVAYVPSSPYADINTARDNTRGDGHLWNVWVWGQPVEMYDSIRGRFFSEYGFQSMPSMETIMKFAPDTAQHFLSSNVMMAHQRAGAHANGRMMDYMLEAYPEPKDFESFVYMSHLQQGDAIDRAIRSHRRQKPYNMGSLYWQLNDCWPVASWSSVDYYGNWKAQHYFVRKAFDDIMVSAIENGDSIMVHVVSDRLTPVDGVLKATVYSLDGKQLGTLDSEIHLPEQENVALSFLKAQIIDAASENNLIIDWEFVTGDDTYEYVQHLEKFKDMRLRVPEIKLTVVPVEDYFVIEVSSPQYVKGFYMTLPGEGNFFSDNYFDLLPGKKYGVKLTSHHTLEDVRSNLKYVTLKDAVK